MPRPERSTPTLNEIAERYLGMLAESPDDLMRFMTETGLSPDGLRASVGSPALVTGLVDNLMSNESALLTLCANTGWRPEDIVRIWQVNNHG
jgi:hypothetical protein